MIAISENARAIVFNARLRSIALLGFSVWLPAEDGRRRRPPAGWP
jgi:hypothetical protein